MYPVFTFSDRRRYADVVFRIYVQKLLGLAPVRLAATAAARSTPGTPATSGSAGDLLDGGSTEIPKGFGGIIGPLSPAASSEASLMATPRSAADNAGGAASSATSSSGPATPALLATSAADAPDAAGTLPGPGLGTQKDMGCSCETRARDTRAVRGA